MAEQRESKRSVAASEDENESKAARVGVTSVDGLPDRSCALLPFFEGSSKSSSKFPLDPNHPLVITKNSDRNCSVAAVAQVFSTTAPYMFESIFDDASVKRYLSDHVGSTPDLFMTSFLIFRDLVCSGCSTVRCSRAVAINTSLSISFKECVVDLVSLGFMVDCEDFAKLYDFCCFLFCYAHKRIFEPDSAVRSPLAPLDRNHCRICRALLLEVHVRCTACTNDKSACSGCCSVIPLRLDVAATSSQSSSSSAASSSAGSSSAAFTQPLFYELKDILPVRISFYLIVFKCGVS